MANFICVHTLNDTYTYVNVDLVIHIDYIEETINLPGRQSRPAHTELTTITGDRIWCKESPSDIVRWSRENKA